MVHHPVQDQSQSAHTVEPTDEMLSPSEADVTVLAAAMRRTAQQLANDRQNKPEFADEMNNLITEAHKHAEDLGLPGVAKALLPDS
ncbi:hypothetical protein OG730_42120 (plasmid) [Streptomyces sp. NBC_01298]|uniref:hypothetical protein n=1 Tax=Streptomyces sp. NBC_01298 TaxID=2903817 RepID=UPI002E12991C|nr:hypothetical protein OG730_42120 [Streptomyces sp. NBC_01298]